MAAANPDPSADPQQYQQDSLQVDASQWSQSRSARRKQKRKEHTMQCSPMVAGSTVTCTVQPTKQLIAAIAASESTDTDQNIPAGRQTHSGSAVAVVAAASGAQPLHAKQRSKRSGSRAASPLGKKQDAGNRGRGSNKTSLQGRLDSQADRQQDVEAVQIVLQEEAESQIMASSAVSRARAANADFCQVERSHRSGSNVGLSPRRALLDLSAVSRTSSDSRLVSQLSSATSLVRAGSAELPQLTDPEIIQKVVKKIKAIHVSCNSDDSNDVVHMLGSIQATLKAYAAVERLWLVEQPFRVKHIYLCKCFPGTDAKMVHAVLSTSNSSVDQAITVLEKRGLTHVPSAFCLKDVFQGVQKMDGSQWVVVWDTCALMKDLWVGYQLLEEVSVYQVIPFMTHLELNHIKDDKSDPEKAHKGQEVVKLVSTGLQAEYKGRFKLQAS
ncbi:TPA: hypothetical protein ACH3X1_004184 [Trebouxia sp. C0004]